MCQEKEEEDTPAMRIAWMQQFTDTKNSKKKNQITATNNRNVNIRTNNKIIKFRKQKWEEKQSYEYLKWQTQKIVYEIIWIWLRRGKP